MSPTADAQTLNPPPPPRSARRVLLVDDNLDALELLADYLRECGHDVVIASEADVALARARGFAPEVAVLDIGLPGMNGYELARRLRDELGGPCRFIALTGYSQERDRNLSAQAGFECHLLKPVDAEKLAEMITEGP